MNLHLLAISILVTAALLAVGLSRWPRIATATGTFVGTSGALLGLYAACRALADGREVAFVDVPARLPTLTTSFGCDPLSNFFLVPLFLLAAVTGLYGRSYFGQGTRASRRIRFVFLTNFLTVSMALVLMARQVTVFLIAWETMSLLAYFLITLEHEQVEVQKAGLVYLILAHIGVTCVIVLFLLLAEGSPSLLFADIQAAAPRGTAISVVVFLLALLGFGMKAGLLPLHVWLPQAHAAAPSPTSALMSGVLVKLGIYGILRVIALLRGPPSFVGPTLLVLGVCTALYGISLSAYQRDLKRVLAYSTVENMGIVALGLGLGFWGQTAQHPLVSLLGFGGALLHLYHHAVMKGLMFCLSGEVLHACGTKDLEQMGGLAKRLPKAFLFFLLGSVALAGLPPLNAFVSEWLLYRGLMEGALVGLGSGAVACMFAMALLSLVSAIAALVYARLVAISMLGEPRSSAARQAREAHPGRLLLLAPLGVVLVLQALVPDKVLELLRHVLRQLGGEEDFGKLGSLGLGSLGLESLGLESLGNMNLVLLLLGGVIAWLVARILSRQKRTQTTQVPTWDCGFSAPTVRMQYGARGVSELLTEVLVPGIFAARIQSKLPEGIFPGPSSVESDLRDPLTRDAYEPLLGRLSTRIITLRLKQQGHLHQYLLYILFALLFALAYAVIRSGGVS